MKKVAICILTLLISGSATATGNKEEAGSAEPLPHFYFSSVEPESLDPALIVGMPVHFIFMALFEGLVTYDAKSLEAVAGVAESWEITGDGMTYTFRLRDDAIWSDGTPITARQFVSSWVRVLDPETASKNAYMLNMVIKGAREYNSGNAGSEAVCIRAVNEHTFQFDLVGPVPYVLDMLSHFAFSVQPLHTIEKHQQDWITPENFVGNGPFVLEDWIPQDRIVVHRSDIYWDRENVKLGRITFLAIENDSTAFNMFLLGEIAAFGVTPPLPYYPAVAGFRENVATAKKLPAEAGYPNGDGFPRLTIQYNTHEQHKRIAEYIQHRWNENLGIEVELVNLTRNGRFF